MKKFFGTPKWGVPELGSSGLKWTFKHRPFNQVQVQVGGRSYNVQFKHVQGQPMGNYGGRSTP